ncbi:TolB family protein [Frondihabitans cladoniiphilus]|uniref:PD40 domain-containing protein n=1 Tax=Frondihabitans cladoniiphilus TaxID=715785 RepID=A0ABP8VZU1_9MICO
MPRSLFPGQHCRVLIVDATTGATEVVFDSEETLVEAPNWSPDGRFLVLNGDGLLWRLAVDRRDARTEALEPIAMHGVPEINNDHVLAPDSRSVFVSGKDGHLYEVPWAGGPGRRVTRDHPEGRGYKNYLHGVSPDGTTLAVVVGSRPTPESTVDEWRTNLALVSVATGETLLVTDDVHPDDGPEFAPDGEWLWFNTERFTAGGRTGVPGHAQLARVPRGGGEPGRVVVSDTVDWFPHPSPDGSTLVFLSYAAGTQGHPENHEVVLRVLELHDGEPVPGAVPRDLLRLFGGQGTLNVSGWAPDSRRFACVEYPLPT